MSSYDEVCRVSVTPPPRESVLNAKRARLPSLFSLGVGKWRDGKGRRTFLRMSIAHSNAYVTSSVHRQSIRIPAMIKNAGESIARGAPGHAACISLTRHDTIDG